MTFLYVIINILHSRRSHYRRKQQDQQMRHQMYHQMHHQMYLLRYPEC